MVPATPIGIERWLSRREMFVTGFAAWAGGFALAAFAVSHAQWPATATHATDETSADNALGDNVSTDTSSSKGSAEAIDSTGAVFLPEDAIVASHAPRAGAAQVRRP